MLDLVCSPQHLRYTGMRRYQGKQWLITEQEASTPPTPDLPDPDEMRGALWLLAPVHWSLTSEKETAAFPMNREGGLQLCKFDWETTEIMVCVCMIERPEAFGVIITPEKYGKCKYIPVVQTGWLASHRQNIRDWKTSSFLLASF